jgi:hypothetical protein
MEPTRPLVYRDDVAIAPDLASEIASSELIELGLVEPEGAPERMALADYARRPALEEAFELWKVLEWDEWVERESPRREAIKLYNALYMLRQQLDGVSDVPLELACGIGFATLARSGKRLRYPLLTVVQELSLDGVRHCIEVRLSFSPRLQRLGRNIDTQDCWSKLTMRIGSTIQITNRSLLL